MAYLTPTQAAAAAELELRRREAEPLLDFVPRISPKLDAPTHLSSIVDLFERSLHEPVFGLISVPPQFGKTELVLHGFAYRMRKKPTEDNAYVSYIANIAEQKSVKCREYAEKAGVEVTKSGASHWMTKQGGNFYATGIGGPLTSLPISGMLAVDDPFKNREECERYSERERVEEWLDSVAFPRCHPGTSILVIHTRWHEDDLIARLMKRKALDGRKRFEVINLQAIDEYNGHALWEKGRPKEWLLQRRIDVKEHNWWSLYMGKPRPKGGELFRGISAGYWTTLPNRYRIGKGVDFGYSARRKADHSCGIVMLESNGDIYLVDREYAQKKVVDFIPQLKRQTAKYRGAYNFLCSSLEAKGMELGGTTLDGVPITSIPTTSDKWARAQAFAGAWNGVVDEDENVISKPRIYLPPDAPWLAEFLDEIGKFTGDDDANDDQVDAAINAFWDFKDVRPGRSGIYVPKDGAQGYRVGAGRGLG